MEVVPQAEQKTVEMTPAQKELAEINKEFNTYAYQAGVSAYWADVKQCEANEFNVKMRNLTKKANELSAKIQKSEAEEKQKQDAILAMKAAASDEVTNAS